MLYGLLWTDSRIEFTFGDEDVTWHFSCAFILEKSGKCVKTDKFRSFASFEIEIIMLS